MADPTRFRFNFTAVRNWPATADAIQLSEIRFYRPNGQRHFFDSSTLGATNPMGSNPLTQGPRNLVDDATHTKWCAPPRARWLP